MSEKGFTQAEVDVAIEVSTLDKGMTPAGNLSDLEGCTKDRSTCERYAKQIAPTCSTCSRKM